MGKVDDDDQEVTTEHSLDSWNPFDSDDAFEGHLFFGKLSFLCLGPASDFFSETSFKIKNASRIYSWILQ